MQNFLIPGFTQKNISEETLMSQGKILSIVGKSGAGKTALMEKLIRELKSRGLRVGTIKHDTHGFEMDAPGKDSWRHKQAGSATTIISSPHRIGLVMDVDHDHELDELDPLLSDVDIILSEGYKREDKPKVEVFRSGVHQKPLCTDADNLIAMFSDEVIYPDIPCFAPDDVQGLADFLLNYLGIK